MACDITYTQSHCLKLRTSLTKWGFFFYMPHQIGLPCLYKHLLQQPFFIGLGALELLGGLGYFGVDGGEEGGDFLLLGERGI